MTRIFFHADLTLYLIHTRISRISLVRGGALTGFLNTNNANDTNIFFAHGGAERNVDF